MPKGVKHGLRYSPEYNTWCDVIKRCNNPKTARYRFYGGRGITVCDRWLKFENFYADMGPRPEGHSIDRIDSNGPYSPENCRWADQRTQTVNRRNLKLYSYEGKELTLPEICASAGVNYRTVRNRLFRSGMTLEEALVHEPGTITTKGMERLKAAVIQSNIRRGHNG